MSRLRPREVTVLLSGALLVVVLAVSALYLMNAGRTTPIEVVSVIGPVPPITPGGPTVSITLKNTGDMPIMKLTATLLIPRAGPTNEPFTYDFDVNPSNPLLPNQSVTENLILIGGGFDSDHAYSLTVSGNLMDGTYFSYTFTVRISQP